MIADLESGCSTSKQQDANTSHYIGRYSDVQIFRFKVD